MEEINKLQQENERDVIVANIPTIPEGESIKITNWGGSYVATEIVNEDNKTFMECIENAEYDTLKLESTYSQLLENENSTYVVTSQELTSLAQNTQSNISKINKINGLIKYNINKSDIISKVVSVIENNINTNYRVDYPKEFNELTKKKDLKMVKELKDEVEKFNGQINIEKLIVDCVNSTFQEGNFVVYLKGDFEKGVGFAKFPLGVVEITEMNIDNEPLVVFNINELKSRLQKTVSKYGRFKAKQKIDNNNIVEHQIQRDYPEEVYEGFKVKDKYCYLDPARVGVVRIGNNGGMYGLSPIFKALSPLLMLDHIYDSDIKTLKSKSKKIFFQKLRKDVMGETGTFDVNQVGYAQNSLLKSMSNEVVVYTAIPHVEDLTILEPQSELVDKDTSTNYRNMVFDALGIGFVTNTSKNGANTVQINYQDLLKTINKIVKELERIINKFYKTLCEEKGFVVEYAPTIKIQDTRMLDFDSVSKLVEMLFSKASVSYKTTFELLGMNVEEEVARRLYENENDYDEIFMPHVTSYVVSGNDTTEDKSDNGDKNKNGSKKSEDKDKALYDKDYNGTQRE